MEEGQVIAAMKLQDHRLAYLDYEGPVSNNRGQVTVFDKGRYKLSSRTRTRWEIELHGLRTWGKFVLERGDQATGAWTLIRPARQ